MIDPIPEEKHQLMFGHVHIGALILPVQLKADELELVRLKVNKLLDDLVVHASNRAIP